MLLLIPGPVATRPEVKMAFAQDYAPWDLDFRAIQWSLRERVLRLAGGSPGTHSALALQGCGHFAMEAAIRTFVKPGGRMLVPDTGAYAQRLARLAREAGRAVVTLPVAEATPADPAAVAAALAADPGISHVAAVYSETGSGVCHDVQAIGRAASAAGRRMIVDAVSAFGALPLDVSAMPETDAVVFTANKCLEGMPGIGFIVVAVARVLECAGNAGSWSFDLADVFVHGQHSTPGTWRFTPAAQAVAALDRALDFYDAEGGQPARLARYRDNQRLFYRGMRALGLEPDLPEAVQGPIVVNIKAPADPNWNLQNFVDALKARGVMISNFHNTPKPSFRVGCIGHVMPADMEHAVRAIDGALAHLMIRNRKGS